MSGRCYARRMERHFTVSGFVSDGERTALHWHRIGKWLPGRAPTSSPTKDPVQAVLREVLEETGIEVEVLPTAPPYPHPHPPQLPPPVTIGVYDLEADDHSDGPHQHIDFVYFTRPAAGASPALPDNCERWVWVPAATLRDRPLLPLALCGADRPVEERPIAEDVRRLALASIRAARAVEAGAG